MGLADRDAVILSGLSELAREFLLQILANAEPDGNPDVLERLYSTPTGGSEPQFDHEWQELIGPDLGEAFKSARDVVSEDLATMSHDSKPGGSELRIPAEHLDAWINTLNQARLAIAARHHFTEREMDGIPPEDHPYAEPLMQMHFYGSLQEHFIRALTK
jgi:hypothetical protein